ncbi:MAG: tetraacyldisaccharide 4'-kinase [Prevotella sp.]|nr:tetraacyldisaccharide 4'-kinase [Prevotella sp.]
MRIHKALLPVSWLYGLGVAARNLLFDCGFLKSRSFDIPVICVGNLAVGGTGKTPHVEHLVRLLKDRCKVAVLSRGYKRRTTGFVLADDHSTALDIGDEPMQVHGKFSDIIVAVDEDRCEGIERLIDIGAEVVLLDDAFQHRYVKPSLSILLIEHGRMKGDRLMPAGRLREPLRGMRRADIVVVTKCPDHMLDGDYKEAERHLLHRSPQATEPSQKLFFSRMAYKSLEPVFPEKGDTPSTINAGTHVLMVTGIANPAPLEEEVRRHTSHLRHLAYGDHHAFSDSDIADINKTFAQLPEPRLLVTTEKDAARLRTTKGLSSEVAAHACLIPIQVELLRNEQDAFDQAIISHLTKKMLASGSPCSDKQQWKK